MNEYLKLLSIVAAPLILILMLAILLYQNRHSDRIDTTFMAYNTAFDPYHGLASQPIFWMTIAYPIGLFFSTGFWAWYDYNLSITAEGFIKFIEISKLSLGLLGLSIPLAVLTARLHGTKQTALQINKTQSQIKETQQKNKTDLYLAHYKHFCDHINELEKKWLKRTFSHMKSSTKVTQFTINKKKCYDILYPESSLHNGISAISSILYDQQIKLIPNSTPKCDTRQLSS
ncbi:hypothetical protein ACROAG_06535 [Shewanella oncorhynchi]|uniref:hypothetical protein n=1 Tax=Shewanella oncorhynchi TaxID=2726434 RepID=UPI003D79A3DF